MKQKYKMNYLGLLLTIPTILTQGILHGQTNDPFSNKPGEKAAKSESSPDSTAELLSIMYDDTPRSVEHCYEEFSLPLDQAAALQRRRLTGEGLYQEVLSLTKDGVAVQETLMINYARSGRSATTLNNTEIIQPADTPKPSGASPDDKGKEGGEQDSTSVPATVFQSRKLGSSFQSQPTLIPTSPMGLTVKGSELLRHRETSNSTDDPFAAGEENLDQKQKRMEKLFQALKDGDVEIIQWIHLRCKITQVTQEGQSIWKNSDSTVSEFPNFQVKEIETDVVVKSGTTSFLGTSTMPTVREPGSELPTKRVWFAFVTATAKTAGS